MKQTLEKLWSDYLSEECAIVRSDEERRIMKISAELQENLNSILNKEQIEAVEKYVDALCNVESFFVRRAFIKGCEFAVSFILETQNYSPH